jgi:glycosyltransferase involved in cell wall biosynthesis
LKVSIVTVCYNSESFIKDAIDSVINQIYDDIEYIIIDGASTDKTVDIVKSYGKKITKFISEPDKGIYDAMNKGIKMASGDIIAILNSDDFYASNNVIEKIVKEFQKDNTVDAIYGDLWVVFRNETSKIKRRYEAKRFNIKSLEYGIMPGHATIFIKKTIYEKYGLYKTDYKIAADFDLIVRTFYTQKIKTKYLPQIVLKARTGGTSDDNLFTKFKISKEVLRACKENNLQTNLLKINLRILIKLKLLITAYFRN